METKQNKGLEIISDLELRNQQIVVDEQYEQIMSDLALEVF